MRKAINEVSIRRTLAAVCGAMLTCVWVSQGAVAAEWAQEPAPTTTKAGWELIDKHLAELDSQIQVGKIGSLGSAAYGIANAFKAVAGLSTTLPADQRAIVQGDVKVVGSEVSKLDKAGEHNDPAGVRSHLQALKETLTKDRAYYH